MRSTRSARERSTRRSEPSTQIGARDESLLLNAGGVRQHKTSAPIAAEIEEKAFDLSINRYKEAQHEEMVFEPPKVIIAKLRKLEAEIAKDLSELEAML